jgi:hypothetical protein
MQEWYSAGDSDVSRYNGVADGVQSAKVTALYLHPIMGSVGHDDLQKVM